MKMLQVRRNASVRWINLDLVQQVKYEEPGEDSDGNQYPAELTVVFADGPDYLITGPDAEKALNVLDALTDAPYKEIIMLDLRKAQPVRIKKPLIECGRCGLKMTEGEQWKTPAGGDYCNQCYSEAFGVRPDLDSFSCTACHKDTGPGFKMKDGQIVCEACYQLSLAG